MLLIHNKIYIDIYMSSYIAFALFTLLVFYSNKINPYFSPNYKGSVLAIVLFATLAMAAGLTRYNEKTRELDI